MISIYSRGHIVRHKRISKITLECKVLNFPGIFPRNQHSDYGLLVNEGNSSAKNYLSRCSVKRVDRLISMAL